MTIALRQRQPRVRDGKHLNFIRSLPCIITGKRPVDAAHIRYGDISYRKRGTGAGEKPDDKWTVPLHHSVHMDQHSNGERQWWESKGIDPLKVAWILYAISGDIEDGEKIVLAAKGPLGDNIR